MIEYSYQIDRDEGKERKTYTPGIIPTKIPVLSSIEGPNSSGKSTLLHLIGICFEGINRKSINNSLKGKMESLLDMEYQDLQFDIRIKSKSETLRFIKEKGKTNIDRLREIDGDVEYIDVRQQYDLIYDIPINPVERLRELTKEVSIEQEGTESSLRNFQSYLRDELNKAKNKNPVLIEELERRIKQFGKSIDILSAEKEELSTTIERVERCRTVYLYNFYDGKRRHNAFHKKKEDKAKKNANNKLKSEYNSLLNLIGRYKSSVENEVKKVQTIIDELTMIDSEKRELWRFVDVDAIFVTGSINKAHREANLIITTELKNLNKSNEKDIDQYYMVVELVRLLNRFIEKDMELPGNNVSIDGLLAPLNKCIKDQKRSVDLQEKIKKALNSLKQIDKDLSIIEDEKYQRYKELKLRTSEFYEITDDTQSKEDSEVLYKKYKQKAISLGINVEDHSFIKNTVHEAKQDDALMRIVNFSDDQFSNYINIKQEKLDELQTKLSKLHSYKKGKEIELEDIRNRPESKYNGHIPEIERYMNIVGDLINKFNQYKQYSNDLYEKRTAESEEYTKYSNALGTYLANKLDTILHIDNEYKLKSVDILNNTFNTTDGINIRFSDMGTGQSQSAYLKSKLNAYSGKKMVALFDEIAMMDSKSMKPIYDKMIDMYDNDELLTAIVVQKGDTIVVKSIEEVIA